MRHKCLMYFVFAISSGTSLEALAGDLGTAFTYQGSLENSGGPVTDTCDFRVGLWDALAGGSPVGTSPQTVSGVPVTGGIFTLGRVDGTSLDFGSTAIVGTARWLEMEVKCTSDAAFVLLSPRVELTPAPHALALPGLYTQQNDTSPNLIGGYSGNLVVIAAVGGTIGGGGRSVAPNVVFGEFGTVGGGEGNTTTSWGTVGGGFGNTTGNRNSTVAGGANNTADGDGATVGGGDSNTANNARSVVAGGFGNTAAAAYSCIGGGVNNNATEEHSVVGGGFTNTASGSRSTVGGGGSNLVSDNSGTVGGGSDNQAGDGVGTTADAPFATVSGGESNLAISRYSFVGGGRDNEAIAQFATIGGGGASSDVSEPWICNGGLNEGAVCGRCPFGGAACSVSSSCTPPICVRDNTVCPGYCGPLTGGNRVTDDYGTIGGGGRNRAGDDDAVLSDAPYATVGGGSLNIASAREAMVGGGLGNMAGGTASTVAGGSTNDALANYSTVGGGLGNTASGQHSTVAGGDQNFATGSGSAVGGGSGNLATATFSTVPGGSGNVAGGARSFAAGWNARVRDAATVGGGDLDGDEGTFLWADATGNTLGSTAPNQFLVRASGGSAIYSNSSLTAGVTLAAGGGSWASVSDGNLKENFAEVDKVELLRQLDEIPIKTWNYKSQDAAIRHMGPIAQDFYEAFGVGEEETKIATIDADGVALAAIQGLHQLLQDKECEIEDLRARLLRLEALLSASSAHQGGKQ